MCGIFGIINKSPEAFDYATFCCLGLANDARGGDSCGIFIDGKSEYGIKNTALFTSFFWDSELLNNTHKAQIAIGHDRKASVGGVTLAKAHPIIINDQNGKPKFVLVHNGTIHNYMDLAKEYIPEIDCSSLSDSQVLALILYHKGFDVLSKYNGGTAFCIVYYQEEDHPIVYLYKGGSKILSTSKEATEERPLYISYSQDTGELVFSSILSFLYVQRDSAQFLKPNVVYKYEDGELIEYKSIDRSQCIQTKIAEKVKVIKPEVVPVKSKTYDWKYLAKSMVYNTYTVGGKPAHGKYIINDFGRIIEDAEKGKKLEAGQYPIYFFEGIPLVSSEIFSYFCHLAKKSWCEDTESFARFYQNLVRYFSLDRIYSDNGVYYIATGFETREVFTGNLQPIGCAQALVIEDGFTHWQYVNGKPYAQLYADLYPKLNYKEIWKQLKQYIRSQEMY